MKVKIGSESTSFKEDFHTKKHPLKRSVFMVRKAGIEPHGGQAPTDFKSVASTSSAISA